jgi:hypothetical protein
MFQCFPGRWEYHGNNEWIVAGTVLLHIASMSQSFWYNKNVVSHLRTEYLNIDCSLPFKSASETLIGIWTVRKYVSEFAVNSTRSIRRWNMPRSSIKIQHVDAEGNKIPLLHPGTCNHVSILYYMLFVSVWSLPPLITFAMLNVGTLNVLQLNTPSLGPQEPPLNPKPICSWQESNNLQPSSLW